MSDRGKIQRRFISVLQLDVYVLRNNHFRSEKLIFFSNLLNARLIRE